MDPSFYENDMTYYIMSVMSERGNQRQKLA